MYIKCNVTLPLLQSWIISCISFNFLAIGEYFLILCHVRYALPLPRLTPKRDDGNKKGCNKSKESKKEAAKRMDKFCLFLSPCLFAVFCGVYWSRNIN